MGGFADHVRARAGDGRIALMADDRTWTYAEWVQACADRASLFRSMRLDGPPHVGVLLDNVPEYTMWLGAAALAGSTVVGVNPTRRGEELARDVRHTECQLIVTDAAQAGLLDGLDLGAANGRVLVVDGPSYEAALAPHVGAALPDVDVDPSTQILLMFTSGTSGAPKAVICSQGRLEYVATAIIGLNELTAADVTYVAMPLFHSNALFTGWAPSVVAGATVALRPRFSASAFLADVRRYGATYFNYVGKPLSYVLATPEQPDDADNPLRRGYGNEANDSDLARFQARFGCTLNDGYGQSEMGASIIRVPGMPAGALGVAAPTVKVLDPATGEECPPARFDEQGRLLNGDAATGEIVNTGDTTFEGYWNNDEANRERLRGGWYWTGDLGYRDEAGFFYFAGRSADWLRVDGENFAAAPVERILMRWPAVQLVAVYGVPDPDAGDRVMVAVLPTPGHPFDPDELSAVLAAQPDLGPKWSPTFVRVVDEMPMTQTNKVLKRQLVAEGWQHADPVWWRPERTDRYRPMTDEDRAALSARFEASGRAHLLDR